MAEHADEHDALNCPECRAASKACRVLGGIGEAIQRMLDNGTFERLGAKMAEERERRIIEAFLADTDSRARA